MLACIPTKGDAGLEDTVHDHFGSAPFFTLYDSSTEEVTVLGNSNAGHDHGTCHPMNQLARYRINAVVCAGMGRRAIEALNAEGIKIYQAKEGPVSAVVEQIKSESLTEIDPAKACRGRGQRGGCAHGPLTDLGPGQGRGSGYGQAGRGGGQGRGGRGRKQG